MVDGLHQLDSCRVAIEVRLGDEVRVLRGKAEFDSSLDGGAYLRVQVSDVAGDIELVIAEDSWCGEIRHGGDYDCDYVLSLDSACVPEA